MQSYVVGFKRIETAFGLFRILAADETVHQINLIVNPRLRYSYRLIWVE